MGRLKKKTVKRGKSTFFCCVVERERTRERERERESERVIWHFISCGCGAECRKGDNPSVAFHLMKLLPFVYSYMERLITLAPSTNLIIYT